MSLLWTILTSYVCGDKVLLAKLEYLSEENRIYREHIGKSLRLSDTQRHTLASKAMDIPRKYWADIITIVSPRTLLAWHRRLIKMKYDYSHKRKPGRPRASKEVEMLITKLAQENPTWGYDRLADQCSALGHDISDQTVGNILKRLGIEPAPKRSLTGNWKQFIETHKNIWSTDFFTVEAWTPFGLTTYYVLFFLHIHTRKVVIAGITQHPDETWMKQIAKNLTGFDGELAEATHLIHDRDTKYSKAFSVVFEAEGCSTIKLPARSPNLNAFAERWVKTVKTECLDHLIPIGEQSIRKALKEYLKHYHSERHHQGINHTIPFPDERSIQPQKSELPIKKCPRLGGLLNFYYRDAA